MSDPLSRTEQIKMLPEQVAQIHKRMDLSDSKIMDMGKEMVDMGKTMVRVETVLGTVEKTMNLLVDNIDDRNEKLRKSIGALEKWRNWTMGIFASVAALIGFFKETIITFLTNHK